MTFRLNFEESKDVSKFLILTTFESFKRGSPTKVTLQKSALKTSIKFSGEELLIKYSTIIPCDERYKEKVEAAKQ